MGACLIEWNGKWGHAKNDHRSHIKGKQLQQTHLITPKAGTWELLTSNKLLQTALRKWMHSSSQLEAAIFTYHHTVGVNGLGLNRPCHQQAPTKSFKKCSISNDLDGMEDGVLWGEQYDKSDTDSNEEGDDMYDDTLTDVQWRELWWWFF